MTNSLPDPIYEQIERGLAEWARGRADVLAIIVIGSRARSQHPADAWSDLDTIIFVEDPKVYVTAGEWQAGLEAALGIPAWFAAFGWTFDDPEWEYVLADGRKVDMVFTANRAEGMADTSEEATAWQMAAASRYTLVFERGARVLFDRSRIDSSQRGEALNDYTQTTSPAPLDLPDQAAFDNRIANYLLELVRAAKIARRGEFYRAARILNEELQDNLLALIELHAYALRRPGAGFWRYGRFLEEWADPRALLALPDTHSRPTLESANRAVLAALALLEWLGPEAAQALGLRFPEEMLRPTAEWLRGWMEAV